MFINAMNFKTLILLVSLSCCSELFSMNRFTRVRSVSSCDSGLAEEAPSPSGIEAVVQSPMASNSGDVRVNSLDKLIDKLSCCDRLFCNRARARAAMRSRWLEEDFILKLPAEQVKEFEQARGLIRFTDLITTMLITPTICVPVMLHFGKNE